MFVFSKGKVKTFNPITDRPVRKKCVKHDSPHGRSTDGNRRWNREPYETKDFQVRFNVWEYNIGNNCSTKDKEAFKHPAIFPEKLAHEHIVSWSNEGDVVYDCFLGSGTTAKMAAHLKRHFIGFELNKEYFDKATKRIKAEQSQLCLF